MPFSVFQFPDWHCALAVHAPPYNDPSLCEPALLVDGEACTKNAQCQSENCDVGNNQCIAAPLAAIGAACADNAACESLNCDNGNCAVGIVAEGEACTANEQCQSNNCGRWIVVNATVI